jgi:hypothetical protein
LPRIHAVEPFMTRPDDDLPTPSQIIAAINGQVHSSDGWTLRPLGVDLLEYDDGRAACLINIGSSPSQSSQASRPIYASESVSELFPHLREHLRLALPYLKGHYVVV